MFTLAHLSDPHIGPLPEAPISALLTKRVLGYLSWNVRRKNVHSKAVLDALAADIVRVGADHVVVTGDITNIALPEEFPRAAAWLRGLGPTGSVSIVPGNHDAYTGMPWEQSLAHWADFMSGDDGAPGEPASFPYVRERGPVAIVGVSTAQPTAPFLATGTIGAAQLAGLDTRLAELGERGLFRIVLIHHPPGNASIKHRKRLTDADEFRSVVSRRGAELVLHGHTHKSTLEHLPAPHGRAPVLGVTSASANRFLRDGRHARYHLYRIERGANGWEVAVEVRELSEAGDAFAAEDRFTLSLAA